MNPVWILRTGRLVLRPMAWSDLPEVARLKADPLVFARMLGGVRTRVRAAEELAEDIAFWAACGAGMFTVREHGRFQGITGVHERPDGRGLALRFALWPEARGRGLAREAAGAALRFTHDVAGIDRVIAVAAEDNFASRMVLGAIGMAEREVFEREGTRMLVYESKSGLRSLSR
jgi:RimJ/RimL family protein N-acetyltransferase